MDWYTDTTHYMLDPWGEIDPKDKRFSEALAIYNKFIRDTLQSVKSIQIKEIPEFSDKVAMIIEPRKSPVLEYVLRNVMYFLGSDWGLQIFTGSENENYIREVTNGWGGVDIVNMGVPNLSIEAYNEMRKSPSFWRKIKGEKILCFETDTLLCRTGIEDYLEYDYIGAPWPENIQINPNVRVGNGGLSLRSRSAMIDICSTCKRNVIPNDDVFFSINLKLRENDYKLPKVDVAAGFAAETMYHSRPLGVHKPWRYMTAEQVDSILNSIDYDAQSTSG